MAESHTRGFLSLRASKEEGESSGKERTKQGKVHFVSAQTEKGTGQLEIYDEKHVTDFFC